MRFSRETAGLAALALVTAACGDGTGPVLLTNADLVGEWSAVRIEVRNRQNHAQKVDGYAMGMRMTLTVTGMMQYSLTFTAPGEPPLVETGVMHVEGRNCALQPEGAPASYAIPYTWSGGTMTWTVEGGEGDIDNDGMNEPLELVIGWRKS